MGNCYNRRSSLLFQVSKLLTVTCCVAAWIAELRHSPPWCQGMLWSGSCWAVLLDRCLPSAFISEIHWSLLWTSVWWWRQFMENVQGLNPVPSVHISMGLKRPVKENLVKVKFRQSCKRKVETIQWRKCCNNLMKKVWTVQWKKSLNNPVKEKFRQSSKRKV